MTGDIDVKGQAAKQVLSELLKKLRAFGLDEPDGDEADPMDPSKESDTDGTDMDLISKNPDADPSAVADPIEDDSTEGSSLDDIGADPSAAGGQDGGLQDEIKKFFQKTNADKIGGDPKGVRMNMTEIKAQPLKRGRM